MTAGIWGVVGAVDDTSVAFIAAWFDPKNPYATVPFSLAVEGTPAKGDQAFLHFDSTGQPAYAVIWPS